MKLRPLQDWAVILPSGAEEMTAGGIYIPDTAKTKPHEGVVEAIGPGAYEEEKHGKKKEAGKERKFTPTTVKPGDRVLYEPYAGRTYKIDGEERILVRERDILGMVGPAKEAPEKSSEKPAVKPAATVAKKTVNKTAKASTGGKAKKTGKKK